MKVVQWINQSFRNKQFKIYVALFSLVQGLYRTSILDNPRSINELFNNSNIFLGYTSLVLGITLLVLCFTSKIVFVKINESLLAATYAAFAISVFTYSPISAIGAMLILVILIIEVSLVNEC